VILPPKVFSAECRFAITKIGWNLPNFLRIFAENVNKDLIMFQSLKAVRKSIEDSLRTSSSRNKAEELEVRKRRCAEFVLGENVATAVHVVRHP